MKAAVYSQVISDVVGYQRSPSIPLVKGEEENSPPFTRGAGGDRDFLHTL